MSIYSTKTISREKAEEMVRACRVIRQRDTVSSMSDKELDRELHEYVYSNESERDLDDVVGFAYNYQIS